MLLQKAEVDLFCQYHKHKGHLKKCFCCLKQILTRYRVSILHTCQRLACNSSSCMACSISEVSQQGQRRWFLSCAGAQGQDSLTNSINLTLVVVQESFTWAISCQVPLFEWDIEPTCCSTFAVPNRRCKHRQRSTDHYNWSKLTDSDHRAISKIIFVKSRVTPTLINHAPPKNCKVKRNLSFKSSKKMKN